jgi:hypothetical protein
MVRRYVVVRLTTASRAYFPAAARKIAATGCLSAAATIVSSTTVAETMAAPAVAVAPACPGTHAQEDAAVEVPRPVKAIGRAGVRRIVVIAVRTYGWSVDVNNNLSLSHWHQDKARQQRCSSEKSFESSHI